MKHIIRKSIGAILLTGALAASSAGLAQTAVRETTTTTTTSAGTISEFGPDRIIIRSETMTDPVRYTYSKTTTYVDETGAPVSVETIKSGVPVTVYYTKVGDGFVANKVIVRKAVAVTTPILEEKKTTTTTTETK